MALRGEIGRNGRPRVVVAGGGFAGLETAFVLRARLGAAVDLTLVSDRPDFLFKPNTIYLPFGGELDPLLIPLAGPARRRDIELVEAPVGEVDPDARTVEAGGRLLPYDYLVIATGAGMAPDEVPGLARHAHAVWTPEQMLALGTRLTAAIEEARQGRHQTILFAVPPGNKCSGPLYELVLMTETYLRRRGVRDAFRLLFLTYEETFIQAFGPKLHDVVVAEFAARSIDGRTGWALGEVDAEEVRGVGGERCAYDLLVAFPPYVASVRYDGLPRDERGFLRTELASRRVVGEERIFAPGDAGDFPVKQAFLAFLQADAAGDAIAAEVAATEPETVFDPVSMCVMEAFDTATFAQVPLELTGDPARPVAVRSGANGRYRVGTSKGWRLGKKMLGVYLPLRFRAGRPFHIGAPWKVMDVGLKGMSGLLARH